MPESEITIRRAIAADTQQCHRIALAALGDLSTRQGVPWEVDPDETWPRWEWLHTRLEDHSAEWWVAENSPTGQVVGYARSVERGGLFELTELFVNPASQSAGVGRRLLDAAFPLGRGEVRVIIATTDVRALSRYLRADTVARFPIFTMEATPLPEPLPPVNRESWDGLTPVPASVADLATLAEIEREVLEFDRGADEFSWLLTDREAWLYLRDGRPVGFGCIGSRGAGPVAALDPVDQPAILTHLEGRALSLGREGIWFQVPAPNEVAVRQLLGRGYKIDPFLTMLLSNRPFGQLDRFIGFSPPFFL